MSAAVGVGVGLLGGAGLWMVVTGVPAARRPGLDDLPDEVDLDLDGWLTGTGEPPPTAEVSELWHLLLDAPHVGQALQGDEIEEAYDDLVEEVPGWYDEHGELARAALRTAVGRLRKALSPQS